MCGVHFLQTVVPELILEKNDWFNCKDRRSLVNEFNVSKRAWHGTAQTHLWGDANEPSAAGWQIYRRREGRRIVSQRIMKM
jgi:hypothetical protein